MNTNNKNSRGYSAEKLALINEILTIAVTTPKRVADVFFYFSPHVEMVEVSVHAGGWSRDGEPTRRFSAYADGSDESPLVQMRDGLAGYISELTAKPAQELAAVKSANLRESAARLLAEASALEAATPAAIAA